MRLNTFSLFRDYMYRSKNEVFHININSEISIEKTKHIILLHGWGKTSNDMNLWVKAFQKLSFAMDMNIWNIGYPTQFSFVTIANQLHLFLTSKIQEGFFFEEVYFLGYSMGGIIARQLVSLGFPITKLASICSPHLGIHWFIPSIDAGVSSVKQNSTELLILKHNTIDILMRDRYLFCSIGYNVKTHLKNRKYDDDTTVKGESARGEELIGEIKRKHIQINYAKKMIWGAPHLEGMNPGNFDCVFRFFASF